MTQHLQNIGPVSCARVLAVLYAIFGLLVGGVFSLFILLSALFGHSAGLPLQGGRAAFSILIGMGSVVFFPVLYGAIGAISGLLIAVIYNFVAEHMGGIELEIG